MGANIFTSKIIVEMSSQQLSVCWFIATIVVFLIFDWIMWELIRKTRKKDVCELWTNWNLRK